jgi:hypothetical protein
VSKLQSVGFKQSQVDKCVFYRGQCVYVLYTNSSILAGPTTKELGPVIADMKKVELNLTVKGNILRIFLESRLTKRQMAPFI